jgi:dephospho-CoA kinase
MGFLVFGLTGGIASGKSTVAARWRRRGLVVIDADEIAREVVAPGTEGLDELARALGPEVLAPDGSLDRKRVAAMAFGDEATRQKLEAVTHPRIAAASAARARQAEALGEPLACYEAALLVERGLADGFRPLVVVTSPEEAQVARAVRRGGVTESEARARIRAQLPLERKVAVADRVIDNGGDLEQLLARADEVLDDVCRGAGVDPDRYPRPR